MRVIYPQAGEHRLLPHLGMNQIPIVIESGGTYSPGTSSFDFTGPSELRDFGGYYIPGLSTNRLYMPRDGFFQVSAYLTVTFDITETGGTLGLTLYNSTGNYFAGMQEDVTTSIGTTLAWTISGMNYFYRDSYLQIEVSSGVNQDIGLGARMSVFYVA